MRSRVSTVAASVCAETETPLPVLSARTIAVPASVERNLFREPIAVAGREGLGIGLYQVARLAAQSGYSIELARSIHPKPENTLDMPGLRVLAVPIAIAALWVRSWSTAVLTGALTFLVVLFLDRWASFGYWLVVLPPVGIVAERALREVGRRLRVGLEMAPVA